MIGRCQLHKIRNVQDYLPEKMRGLVGQRMWQAYQADSALHAQALLEVLAAELDGPTQAPRPVSGKVWPVQRRDAWAGNRDITASLLPVLRAARDSG